MNIKALQGLLTSGALPSTTLVWTAAQPDWQPANATNLLGNQRTKYKWVKIVAVLFLLLSTGLGYIYFWKNEPFTTILKKTANHNESQNPIINKSIGTQETIQSSDQQFLDQYNQLQKDYSHLKAAFTSVQFDTDENQKSRNAATLLKLQAANKTLSEQVLALKITQADPLIRTKYVEATRHLAALKKQLQQKQSESSQTKQSQLNEELSKASSELRKKTAHISMLKEQLQTLRTTLSKKQNIKPTPVTPIARVSGVNANKGIIVFNHGANTGFSEGDTLRIISKHNEALLGYAQLRQIFDLRTTANFEGKDISSIKPGDYILR